MGSGGFEAALHVHAHGGASRTAFSSSCRRAGPSAPDEAGAEAAGLAYN